MPDKHTSQPRLLLNDGRGWTYLRIFPSLPGEQGSSNAILRYHAVQLTTEDLDVLHWHPWSLDPFLIEGIGEESLIGKNPNLRPINQNSAESYLPIEVNFEAAVSSVRPSTQYSNIVERIMHFIEEGKSVHLGDCVSFADSTGIISSVLRRCRSESVPPPLSAVELTFSAVERPQRSSLLKMVADEVASAGATPEHWAHISVRQSLVESSSNVLTDAPIPGADKSHVSSTIESPVSQPETLPSSLAQDSPGKRLGEAEKRIESLQQLLSSRDKTSNDLSRELTAAKLRSANLEGELASARNALSAVAVSVTPSRIPNWVRASLVALLLSALITSFLWIRTARQLNNATDRVNVLKGQIDHDLRNKNKEAAAERVAADEAALEKATTERTAAEKAATEKSIVARTAADKAGASKAAADKAVAAASAAADDVTAKTEVEKAAVAKASVERVRLPKQQPVRRLPRDLLLRGILLTKRQRAKY